MLMTTSSGANMVNSTRAAPAIPSSPTRNLRIACRIAVLFEIGVCLDIIVQFTSVTTQPIGFCPPRKVVQPVLLSVEFPCSLIVLTIICRHMEPPVIWIPFPVNETIRQVDRSTYTLTWWGWPVSVKDSTEGHGADRPLLRNRLLVPMVGAVRVTWSRLLSMAIMCYVAG